MAEIIYNHLFVLFPKLKGIYDYFLKIGEIFNRLNIPIVWVTPAGLQIKQYYLKSNSKNITFKIGSNSKTIVIKEFNKEKPIIHKTKQKQAIIPNIIHSLDASHLMNIINTSPDTNIKYILTVHDCFGTHPNDCEELKSLVIGEFVKIYSKNDFLILFHNRLLQSFSDNQVIVFKDENGREYIKPNRTKFYIPEIPKNGNLDINNIKLSKYFIT